MTWRARQKNLRYAWKYLRGMVLEAERSANVRTLILAVDNK